MCVILDQDVMWKETVETDGLVFSLFPNNIFYGEKSEAKYLVA